MTGKITEVFLWLVIASLIVLIIMNPGGFAVAVSTIGTQVQGVMTTLTGSGYKRAS
jgi:hypothetical protein